MASAEAVLEEVGGASEGIALEEATEASEEMIFEEAVEVAAEEIAMAIKGLAWLLRKSPCNRLLQPPFQTNLIQSQSPPRLPLKMQLLTSPPRSPILLPLWHFRPKASN